MVIEFEKEYLRELYEEGKATSRKYRFQPDVISRYKKAIDKFKQLDKVEELFLFHGFNYKKLTNSDIESVRITDKYRLEFRTSIEATEEDETIVEITICSIIELSNHYK
jgi:proteic killer suppression protein